MMTTTIEITGKQFKELIDKVARLEKEIVALNGELDEVRDELEAAIEAKEGWQP